MRERILRWLPGALALLFVGCGPEAGLWVRVEAPLRVPEQADALHLTVRRASGAVALERTWDLTTVGPFPQTLALYEEDAGALATGPLTLEARVLHGGALAAPWAEVEVRTSLRSGRLEEVVLRICDCEATP